MSSFVELRTLIRIVRRRWWIVVVATILAALVGYLVTKQQTPIYRATTSLAVGRTVQTTELDRYDFQISQELALTYADLGRRQPVLKAVVNALQLGQTWQQLRSQVQIEPVQNTQLLEISVEATSPEQAQIIADEVARQLLLLSQTPLGGRTGMDQEMEQFLRDRLEHLKSNIETAQLKIDRLESYMPSMVMASIEGLDQLQGEIDKLEALIATWESTYASLLTSLQGQQTTNNLAVLEPAQLNPTPIRPRVKLNVLIATIIGLAVGLGLVFWLEYTDDRLRSLDEVSEMLGLAPLGAISRLAGERIEELLLTNQNTFSAMAEDCRLLRSRLLFISKEWPRKIILITSPTGVEGKSLVVANLGIAMVQLGLKTVIVDTNLRNPTQHELFHIPQKDGLTEELRSSSTQLTHHLKHCQVENLHILTSGNLSYASPDRLGTGRMVELFNMLAEHADIVLCDAPEAVTVADTLMLANVVDGVLLIVDAGHTRRETALQAVYNLQQAGANLLGFVLNSASPQARTASLTHRAEPAPVSQLTEEPAPAES